MRVSRIRTRNTLAHKSVDVELPESGIVLVTGPNGSGKTSMLDAVAYAHWGQTVRGTPPWRKGSDGEIVVDSDLATIEVTAKGSAPAKFRWGVPGCHLEDYDTKTKALAELTPTVGDFTKWRRTHVLSSADADHFSGAADKDRKEMIEAILGLGSFETALEECRRKLSEVSSKVETERLRIGALKQQKSESEQVLERLPTIEPILRIPDRPKISLDKALCAQERTLAAELEEWRAECSKSADQPDPLSEDSKEYRTLEDAGQEYLKARKARELTDAGLCTVCEREYHGDCNQAREDEEAADQARKAAKSALEAAVRAQQAAQLERATKRNQAQAALQAVRTKIATQDEAQKALDSYDESCRKLEELHQTAHVSWKAQKLATMEQVCDYEDQIDVAEELLAELLAEQTNLRAAEMTLGLRGVRSTVLADALGAVSDLSNDHLADTKPGVSLELRPYRESKKGARSAIIDIDIKGVGGGYGYKALSGGERRIVDMAMLLAWITVAGSSSGSCGTLWLDELFVSLDTETKEAVLTILPSIAESRCVVVITHDDLVISRLSKIAAMRLEFEAGEVCQT